MPDQRRMTVASALSVVALLVGGCGSGEGGDSTTTTSVTATSSGSHEPSGTTSTTLDDETLIEVSVAGGVVTGGVERVEVELGTTVVIRVTSDAREELHVHGYNLRADVGPEAPVEIAFTADIPGVFEVELEGSGLELIDLQVS